MKGAIITHPGLEAVSGKELKGLIGVDCTLKRSVALFDTEKFEDLCTLCYRSQSAIKVMHLFATIAAKDLEQAIDEIKLLDISEWIKGRKFVVRCKIVDNDMFDTMETEREVGGAIYDKYNEKSGATVDLENPEVTFYVYVCGDDLYFGVDFAGFDLSKRSYRVFALADSVKATVAYSLVRLGGFKEGMLMLDPFTHSGVVTIEAALYACKKPVGFYNKDKFAFMSLPQLKDMDFDAFFAKHDDGLHDIKGITASDSQQRFVRSAEKNAKIAGINKQITFTRMDVEWLDTKFEKQTVDRIISNPPKVSRLLTEKGLEKVFQELFYVAEFVLKPEGRVVLLAKSYQQILNHAQRHHFHLTANFKVMQGKEDFSILIFEKEK
ncbi:MAG: THUMP domain-containing protein [Candidatus Woesearchaeota archaeon]